MSWSAVGVTDSWALGAIALDPLGEVFTASIAVSDTVATSESTNLVIPTLFISTSDSPTTSESAVGLVTSFINKSDSAATSENLILNDTEIENVSDNTTISESLSHYSDQVDANERVNVSIISPLPDETVSVSDTTTASENALLAITQDILFISVSDRLGGSKSSLIILLTDGRLAIRLSNNLYQPL